jgi:MoaA/NifB/PqqE/SkfB family radical SAM enzyme
LNINLKKIPESQGWVQGIGEWAVRQHTFMPRMIDLEVSRVCNLSCPACMRHAESSLANLGDFTPYCTLERFRQIYEQIPTIGTLNFMGDGEPTMNPELNDIIGFAASKNVYTVITTNATRITEKDINYWKDHKVYRVHTSIDAPCKETYESMRVGAIWEKTLENLKLIGKSGIPLCINTVLTNQNISEMVHMVDLAKNVGAREVTYLMPICSYEDDKDIRPADNEVNRVRFRDTLMICRDWGIKWAFPLTLNPTWRRFSFPFIRPEISVEGDLLSRPVDIKPGTYNMGNMFKEGFDKVWRSDAYKELRQVYKDTEIPRGSIISREEYLKRIIEVENRKEKGRFDHCEICPARWGMACS